MLHMQQYRVYPILNIVEYSHVYFHIFRYLELWSIFDYLRQKRPKIKHTAAVFEMVLCCIHEERLLTSH